MARVPRLTAPHVWRLWRVRAGSRSGCDAVGLVRPHGVDRWDVPGLPNPPLHYPPDDDCVDVQHQPAEPDGLRGVGNDQLVTVRRERVRLVVEARVARVSQVREEAAKAVVSVVIARQLGQMRVEEVEDEVVCEKVGGGLRKPSLIGTSGTVSSVAPPSIVGHPGVRSLPVLGRGVGGSAPGVWHARPETRKSRLRVLATTHRVMRNR